MNRNTAAKKIQKAFRRARRHRITQDPITLENIDPRMNIYYLFPRGPKRPGVPIIANRISPNLMKQLEKKPLFNPITRYPLSKKNIIYVNRTVPGKIIVKSPPRNNTIQNLFNNVVMFTNNEIISGIGSDRRRNIHSMIQYNRNRVEELISHWGVNRNNRTRMNAIIQGLNSLRLYRSPRPRSRSR